MRGRKLGREEVGERGKELWREEWSWGERDWKKMHERREQDCMEWTCGQRHLITTLALIIKLKI